MPKEPAREVTLVDVSQLSLRAAIALAVRCARRIQPRFQLGPDFPERHTYLETVERAIHLAEEWAQGVPRSSEELAAAARAAYGVAEAAPETTHHAAYGAAHAALAASQAAAHGGQEVIASVYGACRVLYANCGVENRDLVVTEVRGDYEKLLTLGLDPGAELKPLGPLWPLQAPGW